jgi:hypothetical protein
VLVLDDRPVHERAEVAQRLVVQVAGADPLGHCLGELRGELVHVGGLVGHRHRDLLAGRPLGDTSADLLWQGELAAKVVRPLRRDAEVGAHGGDPVGLAQASASLPAVLELLLLVCERELFALLAVGLDPANLLFRRGVVEEEHDQAAHGRGEAFHVLAAGEAVACLGGEVAALAVVEQHPRLVRVGAPADAGHELAARAEHLREPVNALLADLAARVGGELDVLERDAFDLGGELFVFAGAEVEQQRR